MINPGKIHPYSRIGNPGQRYLGDTGNGERFIALQICTIFRVPEYRIDNIFVHDPPLDGPGPDVLLGIHDSRIKERAAIAGIIHAEFLVQVIGRSNKAVVLRMATLPQRKEGTIGTPRGRVIQGIIRAGIPHKTPGIRDIRQKCRRRRLHGRAGRGPGNDRGGYDEGLPEKFRGRNNKGNQCACAVHTGIHEDLHQWFVRLYAPAAHEQGKCQHKNTNSPADSHQRCISIADI